jgi:hypothetical protein
VTKVGLDEAETSSPVPAVIEEPALTVEMNLPSHLY